jgi:Bacterial extracellular solute-binding proteins, family 5 Middle
VHLASPERHRPRVLQAQPTQDLVRESERGHATKPQPSLLAMLASGPSPVFPCHVSDRDMRTKPIGTGPFKFAEFKSHASIKLTRNTEYWKTGLPHVDAIEWRIVTSRSTRVLAFVAVRHDVCRRYHRAADEGSRHQRNLQPGADQLAGPTFWSIATAPHLTRWSCAAPIPVARSPSLHRHHLGRESRHCRQYDAARGSLGHASGHAGQIAGL